MSYFNGFAIGVFAAAALTVASGSILTRASATSEQAAQPAVHRTTAADLGHARAVSWISTGHVAR